MRAWLEVYLGVVAKNYRRVQEHLGSTAICAVVKADAYGHGIEPIVRTLDREQVHSYAVISLDEALRVRSQSARDVLIFGYLDDLEFAEAVQQGFVFSLYDRSLADVIHSIALRCGQPARVQIKVETGLNRLGMTPGEALELLANPHAFPGLRFESVFTHLTSSSKRESNLKQLAVFQPFLDEMHALGVNLPVHMQNSHALPEFTEGRFDVARIGLALYGVEAVLPGLNPSLQAKTVVIQRKKLKQGEGTSYNHVFVAERDMEIAVIAMGYAEGLSQIMTGKANAIVNGHLTPIIGQICMNLAVIDVTDIPAERGDVVTIIGTQGEHTITVAQMADAAGIRHHEVLTRMGKGLPKVYLEPEEVNNGEAPASIRAC